MAAIEQRPPLPKISNYIVSEPAEDIRLSISEVDNVPYHTREDARPFTYGNLPADFKRSDLHHVPSSSGSGSSLEPELPEEPRSKKLQKLGSSTSSTPSPIVTCKTARPVVSSACPVLRKTPTREEFEEMLLERREQALRERPALDELQLVKASSALRAPNIIHNFSVAKDIENTSKDAKALVRFEPLALHSHSGSQFNSYNTTQPEHNPAAVEALLRRPLTPAFPTESLDVLNERSPSPFAGNSAMHSQSSHHFLEPIAVAPHLEKRAQDALDYWYKPLITREEAIALLRAAAAGTFIIRQSTTYKDAFGLVIRVDKPPALPQSGASDSSRSGDPLVRHFLLERTARGVHLKGCANEPVFASLPAFVYEHSINQLALPCRLLIPTNDLVLSSRDAELLQAQRQLLTQGAACNVLYLFTHSVESLTGDEAVRKAVHALFAQKPLPTPTEVHFKVSTQGITLTDSTRRLFFRRHYSAANVSHCGSDPEQHYWSVPATDEANERVVNKTVFAFVARDTAHGSRDNVCHVFCDLAASQPATAIVSFAQKMLLQK